MIVSFFKKGRFHKEKRKFINQQSGFINYSENMVELNRGDSFEYDDRNLNFTKGFGTSLIDEMYYFNPTKHGKSIMALLDFINEDW